MDLEIDDFFKPIKMDATHGDKDHKKVEYCLQSIDAFARTTHQSLYVIDYHKRQFIYVSKNPLFLCGEKPEDVLKLGYQFYQKYVPLADLEMLLRINEAGFGFYYDLSFFERHRYSISYDFHLINPSGKWNLVNHKLTPLILDKNHNIWLALCVVTHSTATNSGNVVITKDRGNKIYVYDFKNDKWKEQDKIKLSFREKEILALTIQGFNMNQIAQKLEITEATIKFHKKNIFRKLQVKNIAEALSSASIRNLFE